MNCPKCQAPLSATARFCERCGAMLQEPGSPGADPLLGRVLLERYRVLEAIGQGGMGSVYLAEQRMGQATRMVAIKALRRDLTQDAQLAGRFHRESEIVIRLSHPNIIQFHDFGELADGTLIIVMEYIEGGTLQALLKSAGPLPMPRAEHLLEQIVGALEEAHRHGVVHRDLKPQNILITERGGDPDFVKVVDFGIAMRSGAEGSEEDTRLTSRGSVIGTPAYMSPEQFRGEEPDARADVYSLAVIAYEMLTGKLPLQARTPWEWASQHLTVEPEPFHTHAATTALEAHVATAVMRGLSKDRDQRWQDTRSLLRALRGQSPEPAAPTRVLPRAQPRQPVLSLDSTGASEALPLAQTARAPIAPVARPRKGGGGAWLAGAAALLLALFAARSTLDEAAPEPVGASVDAPSSAAAAAEVPRRAADVPTNAAAAPAPPPDEAPADGPAPIEAPAAAVPEEVAPPPEGPPSIKPDDDAVDPNQLLAREGAAALDEGRLDFALTALETAETALGSEDSAVSELRKALGKTAGALLQKQVAEGRCAEARRGVERLARLDLAPVPDPLAEPNRCVEIGEPTPPPP